MQVAERTRIAFKRGIPDRVPIHCWLGLPLIRPLKPENKSMYQMLEWWIDDPLGSIVKLQEEFGLDPMITTYSQHIGEIEIWPRMLMPRPMETDTWQETFHERARGEGWRANRPPCDSFAKVRRKPSTRRRSASAPSSTTPNLPGYGLRLPHIASSSAFVLVAMTSASAGEYQRTSFVSSWPWRCAKAGENKMSVPNAVLSLYFRASR